MVGVNSHTAKTKNTIKLELIKYKISKPSILPLLGMLKFLDLPFRSQVCPVIPRLLPSHTCGRTYKRDQHVRFNNQTTQRSSGEQK
jgi:hypothetical protein